MWTNEQYQLMFQRVREVHIKIEVLNQLDMVIDEIEGLSVGGNISIDNSTLIRRSIDVQFISREKLDINEKSRLWINKKLRLWIGIKDFSDKIHWFNQGIYLINNPQKDINADGGKISIKGFDKMFSYNEQLGNDIKYTAETPLHDAIRGIGEKRGETKFLIESSEYKVPYDLQFSVASKLIDALKNIIELYMHHQVYYNLDGFLVFEKYKNRVNDPFIWEFKEDADFHVSKNISFDYDNIKNYIKVLGKMDEETGLQPKYEMKIEGLEKPYSIENIGEKLLVILEDKYINQEQCKVRCEAEIEKYQNLASTISITTIPIYLINDVNKIIKIVDDDEEFACIINRVNIPLSHDGMMDIQCSQLYTQQ